MNTLAHFFAHPHTAYVPPVTPPRNRTVERRLEIVTNHPFNLVKITGWSIAMHLEERYEPVIEFIQAHMCISEELTVSFSYELFNPTTVKYLFTIIKMLNAYHAAGKNMQIHWNCGEEMDEMLDTGLDLAMLCAFEFKIALQ